MSEEEFDFAIIGAGSAGCVLANRLSQDGARVVLLEAGKWDRDPLIHIPMGIGKIFPERLHDWGYFMQPDPAMDGRGIECARGKVIGGSSSINLMAYVRGNPSDFDRWAAKGLPGWGFRDVLPYFRRMESWEGGADGYRGAEGPMRVQQTRYRDDLFGDFIAAGQQAGFNATPDYNGADPEGFGLFQKSIYRGRRCSAATAYLRPALRRRNLRVIVKAQVSRILMDGTRATGVAFNQGGQAKSVRALREVIVCAGTINTPKLLMLSGIGNPEQLQANGINTVVAAVGVGQDFQDHLSVLLVHRRNDQSAFERGMRYDRIALAMVQSWIGAGGFAGDVPLGVTAFLRTKAGLPAPDVQLMLLASPFPANPYLRPFTRPVPDGYACRVSILHPRSRGCISLASADPAAAPRINGGFLSDATDLDTLVDGIELTRGVMGQPAMAPHNLGEVTPGPSASRRDELAAWIREASATVHHATSTCRMGPSGDPGRVVDAELRVCGTQALRVVDASVMPDVLGGNINAAVMMIAEKAADLMLGRIIPKQETTLQRSRELV